MSSQASTKRPANEVQPQKQEREDYRVNLRLSPEAKDVLDVISDQRKSSYSEVIRRALGTEKFLWEVQKKNGRIIVDIPGEGLKEVVII